MRLIAAIPALNEQRTIGEVISSLPRKILGVPVAEVVVVDDGSTDDTADVARSAGATVISHSRTTGVGGAFHTALRFAVDSGTDVLVTLDGDGQFDPSHLPRLVKPVLTGRADFATASRFKPPSSASEVPWTKRLGNRVMSWLVSQIIGQRMFDVSCGMRCYGPQALWRLYLLGEFTYTQEAILCLSAQRLRMIEIAIPIRGQREYGRSRVARSLTNYASQTLRIILRSYRDYRPLKFFLGLSAILAGVSLFAGSVLLLHYVNTGSFSPHKWLGAFSGLAALCALGVAQIGILGDMMNRHRLYLEELLYRDRRSLASRSGEGLPISEDLAASGRER